MMNKLFLPFLFLILIVGCSNEQKDLTELVSYDSAWKHLEQFDKIAKENNSNRAVGTPGGIASKNYIVGILKGLGLEPVEQAFTNRSGAQGCNVIAEVKGKSEEEVIMIGSHYDSVLFGPGINDNASGVAIVLDIITAIRQNGIVPEKTLRFAFWDSEETGVEGSPFYYKSLSEADKKQIAAYLNIDMMASKGGEIQISDADASTVDAKLEELTKSGADEEAMEMMKAFYGSIKFAEGSGELEQLVKDAYAQVGASVVDDLSFVMNSDTAPFFAEVPTIGISVVKIISETNEDGDDIISFAPCYHQSCDDINNIDNTILEQCLKASSIIVKRLALDKL